MELWLILVTEMKAKNGQCKSIVAKVTNEYTGIDY
jgi:hypothetical protein